jgi:hypothetical protein
MQIFRIHRMKDAPRQNFRWAPHVSGTANVKPKDYEPSTEVGAGDEYAAWAVLRNSEAPLLVGDLLESSSGRLRICKYVGFEDAVWLIPAEHAAAESVPAVIAAPPAPASRPAPAQ